MDWMCFGGFALPIGAMGRHANALFGLTKRVLKERVTIERWTRLRVALDEAPTSDTVRLELVHQHTMRALRAHPDCDENQLRSGLRFWDHGLTGAYLWSRGVDPLCIQWLLTKYDRPLLRKLGAWSGMYPPLPDDHGQVENLFAFSSARGKGIATQFAHAMFDVARDRGLAVLVTNIHEVNEPAHAWAARTGWRKFGVVTRYHIDAPFLRNGSVYVHTVTSALPKPRRVPFTLPWAKLTTAAAAIAAGIKKFSRFGESI